MARANKLFTPGRRYGRWCITGARITVGTNTRYPCRCECGTTRTVSSASLLEGRSRSCGCAPWRPWKAKLNERQVREILEFPWSQTAAAYTMWRERTGLSRKSIYRVRTGRSYRVWFERWQADRRNV